MSHDLVGVVSQGDLVRRSAKSRSASSTLRSRANQRWQPRNSARLHDATSRRRRRPRRASKPSNTSPHRPEQPWAGKATRSSKAPPRRARSSKLRPAGSTFAGAREWARTRCATPSPTPTHTSQRGRGGRPLPPAPDVSADYARASACQRGCTKFARPTDLTGSREGSALLFVASSFCARPHPGITVAWRG